MKDIYSNLMMKLFVVALLCLFLGSSVFGQQNINMSNGSTFLAGFYVNFYDHGGPSSNYSNNESYTYTFTAQENITINFSSFATESSSECKDWDYIKIYDGDANGTLLAFGQTGCSSNTLNTEFDYVATSGKMTIVWKSDNSNTAAGWAATVKPSYAAEFVSVSPSAFCAGEATNVTVRVKNVGTETWYATGSTARCVDEGGATSNHNCL